MLKYLDWCYKHGGDMAAKFDYVPMPKSVVKMVKETWAQKLIHGKPVAILTHPGQHLHHLGAGT